MTTDATQTQGKAVHHDGDAITDTPNGYGVNRPEPSPQMIRVVAMRDEGKTPKDIAEILNLTNVGTVSNAYTKGLRRMGREGEISSPGATTGQGRALTQTEKVTRDIEAAQAVIDEATKADAAFSAKDAIEAEKVRLTKAIEAAQAAQEAIEADKGKAYADEAKTRHTETQAKAKATNAAKVTKATKDLRFLNRALQVAQEIEAEDLAEAEAAQAIEAAKVVA